MPSSVTIFSTRAISWIWKRMVSRFSNISVTIVPNETRRRRLSSITAARNVVALALVGAHVGDVVEGELAGHGGDAPLRCEMGPSLFGDAVGPGDDLQRVHRPRAGLFDDGRVGQVAVAGDDVAAGGLGDLVADLLGDRDARCPRSRRAGPTCRRCRSTAGTSLTLAPVSFIRSRLLKPMFWARRWQGVW